MSSMINHPKTALLFLWAFALIIVRFVFWGDYFISSPIYFLFLLIGFIGTLLAISFFLKRFLTSKILNKQPSISVPAILTVFLTSAFIFIYFTPPESFDAVFLTRAGKSLIHIFVTLTLGLFFFTASWALGKNIFALLKIGSFSNSERHTIYLALGTGACIYIAFLLSVLKIAFAPVVFLVLLLIIAINGHAIRTLYKNIYNKRIGYTSKHIGFLNILAITILFFIFLFAFISSLSGIANAGWDTFHQYLIFPQTYALNHSLVPFIFHPHWGFTQGAEMIYLLGTLLSGTDIVYLINFLFSVLSAYVFCLLIRSSHQKNLLWLIVMFTSLPLFLSFTYGYVKAESILIFFLLVAFLILKKMFEENNIRLLSLLSIIFGIIVSVKIIIAFFALSVCFALLYKRLSTLEISGKQILLSSLIFIALLSPWFIKNYYFYGQPFYPFVEGKDTFTKTIGYSCIPYLTENVSEDRFIAGGEYNPKYNLKFLSNARLTIKNLVIGNNTAIDNVGPWLLILLTILFSVRFIPASPFTRTLVVSSMLYFIFWLVVLSGQMWYLIPAIITIFLLLAASEAQENIFDKNEWLKYLLILWLICELFSLLLGVNLLEKIKYIRGEATYPETLQRIYQHNNERPQYGLYKTWQYIHENPLSGTDRKIVYSIFDPQGYFIEDSFKNFIPDFYGYIFACVSRSGQTRENLEKFNVGYIIDPGMYTKSCGLNAKMENYRICQARKNFDAFIRDNGTLILEEGFVKLYSLSKD